jgi:hypothetical protein
MRTLRRMRLNSIGTIAVPCADTFASSIACADAISNTKSDANAESYAHTEPSTYPHTGTRAVIHAHRDCP